MRVEILVFDGVDELDVIAPLEVLRRAANAGAPFDVRLVTYEAQDLVTGAYGLRFQVDGVIDPATTDILLVGGGGWVARSPAGAWAEAERGAVFEVIRQAAANATVVAGVCTGTMLLAGAGVIGDRRATTHSGARAELESTGATVIDDRVVDHGRLVSAGGVTSGLDLALWLVERFASAELADGVADDIEYERRRPGPTP